MQPNQTVCGQNSENMGHFGFKLNEPTVQVGSWVREEH